MRTVAWLSALALGCMFFSATGSEVAPTAEIPQSKERRLIVNWDEQSMWTHLLRHAQQKRKLDGKEVKAVLEQMVAEHAKAKVDILVHCVFTLPLGTVPPGFRSFYRVPEDIVYGAPNTETETGILQLEEAGYDLIQVLLDRSHKDGMQFIGGMRMNDRHGISAGGPFFQEHPEWRLFPSGGMDYKHEGVRKAVLAVTQEFLERYDVDGLELDWMRWCHMFQNAEAVENAPILTDFMAQMRKLLDQVAKKRGRGKLLLGVRVPPTIEECTALGFDVKAWVEKGLTDFICPSDFAVTDFNTKTDDFTALTKGTQCKVYPSVHPQYIDFCLARGKETPVHSAESYRATAKNFYAFGADGISAYNYQDHWRKPFGSEDGDWPKALSYLTELRDPEVVARGDRRYMYYPTSPTHGVVAKHEKIVLDRKVDQPTDSVGFRMAEDLKDSHLSATLEFKVTGMVEGDEIEVVLNGKVIPVDRIERRHRADVQPAFHLYHMPLSSPPAKFGDNEIRLRLTKSAGTETLVAQEFEVLVRDMTGRPGRK